MVKITSYAAMFYKLFTQMYHRTIMDTVARHTFY